MDVKKRYGRERKIGLTMVYSNIILVAQYFAGITTARRPGSRRSHLRLRECRRETRGMVFLIGARNE